MSDLHEDKQNSIWISFGAFQLDSSASKTLFEDNMIQVLVQVYQRRNYGRPNNGNTLP